MKLDEIIKYCQDNLEGMNYPILSGKLFRDFPIRLILPISPTICQSKSISFNIFLRVLNEEVTKT